MGSAWAVRMANLWVRIRKWEYWPLEVFQIPVVGFWLWFSLRARSLTFFTASNPGIELGGMFGESKYHILKKIPSHLRPAMALVRQPANLTDVLKLMHQNGLSFPVIFKPNVGERGFRVERIYTEQEAARYVASMRSDFIIQELINLPIECGVFYVRKPNAHHGKVTSVNLKQMLSVTGDGKATLRQLINRHERARMQWRRLHHKFAHRLDEIVAAGEVVVLNHIGNHCLGTMFLNGQHLINPQLHDAFNTIATQIEGFYYGRFDLRCATVEDLYRGNVKILELNGCSSEPAHIYEPGYPLCKAYKSVFTHWQYLYEISRLNHKRGIPYAGLAEVIRAYRKYRALVK